MRSIAATRLARLLAPFALGALAACGTGSTTLSAPVDLTPVNGTHLAVTIQHAPTAIVSGASIEVLVAVARDGNDAYDGDVDLSLAPADGFTAPVVPLARIDSTATLAISVAATRRHGDAPLRIVATSRDRQATGDVALALVVRGPPGALDTSFGTNGVFLLGETNAEATGLALQGDGKIVMGGRVGGDAAVVRVDALGRLDGAFGAGGSVRAPLAHAVSTHDVVVLSTGSIVLGGTGPASSFLARFTPAGALDAGFGSQGIVLPDQRRSATLLLDDAALYVGGQSAVPTMTDAMDVIRLLPDGAADDWGMAHTGEVTLPFDAPGCALGDGQCFVSAMAPKSMGRLTLCASRGDGVNVRELFQGGIEDRNVDLTTTGDVLSRCTGLINNSNDDLWVAGAHGADSFQMLHLTRPTTGGPLMVDPHVAPTAIPAEAALGGASRLAIGGNALLVASADAVPHGGTSQIALVRVNSFTLKLDPAFGGQGYVSTAIGTTPAHARALLVQPDGRIIVAGTNGDLFAARFWQ